MEIAHIYINGQIGSYNDVVGVELQDVVSQVESKKDAEQYVIHINSGGGSVHVGRAIAKYISNLENATTIAETLCGSIATEIHLSRPVSQRKIVAGTQYFIHNPFIESVTGDAETLNEYAAYIKQIEKEMLSMYVNATGASKAAIEGLMAQETSLTDEQAKTLGFVSEILPAAEMKAVAFVDPKKLPENKETDNLIINTLNDMKKDFKALQDKVKAIVENGTKKLRGESDEPEVLAGMVSTDNGELSYASEGALPQVGEAVMIGEEPAPEGTYTATDGSVIVVGADGMVTEVTDASAEVEASVEELKAQIEKMKADHKTEIDTLMKTFETEVTAKVNEVLEQVGSNFVPKAQKPAFNKQPHKKPELSMKEKAEQRKAEIADKKAGK